MKGYIEKDGLLAAASWRPASLPDVALRLPPYKGGRRAQRTALGQKAVGAQRMENEEATRFNARNVRSATCVAKCVVRRQQWAAKERLQ